MYCITGRYNDGYDYSPYDSSPFQTVPNAPSAEQWGGGAELSPHLAGHGHAHPHPAFLSGAMSGGRGEALGPLTDTKPMLQSGMLGYGNGGGGGPCFTGTS